MKKFSEVSFKIVFQRAARSRSQNRIPVAALFTILQYPLDDRARHLLTRGRPARTRRRDPSSSPLPPARLSHRPRPSSHASRIGFRPRRRASSPWLHRPPLRCRRFRRPPPSARAVADRPRVALARCVPTRSRSSARPFAPSVATRASRRLDASPRGRTRDAARGRRPSRRERGFL